MHGALERGAASEHPHRRPVHHSAITAVITSETQLCSFRRNNAVTLVERHLAIQTKHANIFQKTQSTCTCGINQSKHPNHRWCSTVGHSITQPTHNRAHLLCAAARALDRRLRAPARSRDMPWERVRGAGTPLASCAARSKPQAPPTPDGVRAEPAGCHAHRPTRDTTRLPTMRTHHAAT